jgi:hypothetical protein
MMSAFQSGTRRGREHRGPDIGGDHGGPPGNGAADRGNGQPAEDGPVAQVAPVTPVAPRVPGTPGAPGAPTAVPFQISALAGSAGGPYDVPFTGPLGGSRGAPADRHEDWFNPPRGTAATRGVPAPPVQQTDPEEDA